jgi:hypothetical protein
MRPLTPSPLDPTFLLTLATVLVAVLGTAAVLHSL